MVEDSHKKPQWHLPLNFPRFKQGTSRIQNTYNSYNAGVFSVDILNGRQCGTENHYVKRPMSLHQSRNTNCLRSF